MPAHVLVVPLPGAAAPAQLLAEWLAAEPSLLPHQDLLAEVVTAAAAQPRLGEVAAFLTYGDRQGRLVRRGGGARPGADRAGAGLLDRAGRGHDRPVARVGPVGRSRRRAEQVESRCTTSGVPATRLQFLGTLFDAELDAESATELGGPDVPLVEACRWLYPVPGHPDLVWSLFFQTTDLDRAGELVDGFDEMAASLTWTDP